MFLYFLDRSMNIITQGSINLPNSTHISNDTTSQEIENAVDILQFDMPFNKNELQITKRASEPGNYIIAKNNGEFKNYTIIERELEVDGEGGTANLYCEDVGLDLLNEVSLPFSSTEPKDLKFYAEHFLYDSGFEIGVNEITDVKLPLEWTDKETVTSRLKSLAEAFNCDIRFSYDIERLTMKHKYINFYKKYGNDNSVILRLGKEINSIKEKKTITELITALIVTGGTPEGADNPINLNGFSYDDGDIYVDGTMIKSRNALSKWSRYLSETGTDVGHIVSTFENNTTDQRELFLLAAAYLKTYCEPIINYEVDIAYLPDNVKIGDIVNIVDDSGDLYLSSRILKLEISEDNNTKTATLGEFLIKEDNTSDKLKYLAEQFKEIANKRVFYTWVAYADDKAGNGISTSSENKKFIGLAYNKTVKEVDISDPSVFDWMPFNTFDLYRGFITSDNGIILKSDKTTATTMTANVWFEKTDITDQLTIKWYKDGKLLGETRNITITLNNMTKDTSLYSFKAYNGLNEEVCSAEVTVSKIEDGESITINENLIQYASSDQCINPPSTGWSNNIVSVDPGNYLWTKTIVRYSDGTESISYSVSRNGQNGQNGKDGIDGKNGEKGEPGVKGDKGDPGENGKDGKDGQNGKGVDTIITQYYVSDSKETQTGGSWSEKMPVWDINKYLWIRYKITYINPTSIEYTEPFNDATWEVINRLNTSDVNLLDGTTLDSQLTASLPVETYTRGLNYNTNCLLNSDEYVLTFDAMSTVDDVSIRTYMFVSDNEKTEERNVIKAVGSNGVKTTGNTGGIKFTINSKWTRYWVKYTKTPNADTVPKRICVGRVYPEDGTTGEVYIRGVKLTRGNITNGEWSASPNDLVTVINSDTPPENTSVLWCDTSKTPYHIYKYDKTSKEWVIVNDYTEDLNSLKNSITTSYTAAIDLLEKSISSKVEEIQTTTSTHASLIETLKTSVDQNAGGVNIVTTKVKEIIDEITGLATKEEIQKWARFIDGTLILGASDSPFSVRLSNDELGFYENDSKIAFLSNQQLHIAQAVVVDKLQVGDFTIESDINKGLIIY